MNTMKPASFPAIRASSPNREFRMISAAAVDWTEIQAAADGGGNKLPRFRMNLYNGGKMRLRHYDYPVVVDLQGLEWTETLARPVLRDHDIAKAVGHTTRIWIDGRNLYVEGEISCVNEHATEVVASGKNKFPWRSSMGAQPMVMEFVPEGMSRRVNDEVVDGPFYHSMKTVLSEASFVALGADDGTSAQIAAQLAVAPESEIEMNKKFREWLLARGWNDPEGLSETQVSTLQAQFDEEQAAIKASATSANPTGSPAAIAASGGQSAAQPVAAAQPQMPSIEAYRTQVAAEMRRHAQINAVQGMTPDIAAKAIENGWDADRAELEVMRCGRTHVGTAPFVSAGRSEDGKLNIPALTAAVCLSTGLVTESDLEKDRKFGPQVLEAAEKYRGIGLTEVMHMCAHAEGHYIGFGNREEIAAAGFTTNGVSDILSNSMNKLLMAGYESIPQVAPMVCKSRPLRDFKPHTMHRLLGTGEWEKVGSNGELQHGKLDENTYSVQADTYGKLMVLDRKTVVNDDLGAFLELPFLMGQDAANKVDAEFATLLLGGTSSFFHAANNGNLLTGGDSALGITGLTKAHTAFRKQKVGPGAQAKDKRPVNIPPKHLLVPVELEIQAESLMKEGKLITGENATTTANNPHVGKYQVIGWPHLSDTFFSGNSATAWYLLANPQTLPGFIIGWLNGRNSPVIENVTKRMPAQFIDGMAWRGYSDFGFGLGDPKAWVKSAGT